MTDPLIIARRDAGLELTLNRPDCRNALSGELIARLREEVCAAASDPDVRTILITGTPPAFCAGLDLREVARTGESEAAHDTSVLLDLYETLDACTKPIIAAVNGAAVAGGAGLVCVCDVVICGAAAQFGYPGIRHGLVAPIVMPYLVNVVGHRRARYLLLTGEMLSATQTVSWGLADELTRDDELLGRARTIAARLAGYQPRALASAKTLLRQLQDLRGESSRGMLRHLARSVPLTDDTREGLRRFLEP